jgi:alpha-glucosidase
MPWRSGATNAGFSPARPWLPVDPSHYPLAVDVQEAKRDSTLHLTRRIVDLRRRFSELRTGAMTVTEAGESLLVFTRGEGDRALLCAFNLGDHPVRWSLPEGWMIVTSVNLSEQAAGTLPALAGLMAQRL